jgi:hypothetical protein
MFEVRLGAWLPLRGGAFVEVVLCGGEGGVGVSCSGVPRLGSGSGPVAGAGSLVFVPGSTHGA